MFVSARILPQARRYGKKYEPRGGASRDPKSALRYGFSQCYCRHSQRRVIFFRSFSARISATPAGVEHSQPSPASVILGGKNSSTGKSIL